jgi:lipid A ethanolaminephosphotransferase
MRDRVYVGTPTNWTGVLIKLLAIVTLVAVTNFGFFDRVKLLYMSDRWFTLSFYAGVWAVSIGALVIASFQPDKTVRVAWALVLSVSASIAFMYTSVSGSDLSVFDALSLWAARHEAGRAFDFYQSGLFWTVFVFLTSFVVIASPPVPNHRWVRFGLKWLAWTPVVPVFLIAAIIMIKQGGGSQAMPSQFQPLAIGLVTAEKVITQEMPARKMVTMQPGQSRPVKHIVMLIDESVRGDYLDWAPNNPYTPQLAANKNRIVNFGNTVSGGNCSSYSNAILRFGVVADDVVNSARTSPTIWQYAKKVGYRTVFIDGQSGINKDPGLLKNFMTVQETMSIDRVVRFTGIPNSQLDFELLKVIEKELQSDQPVFIYANKNGAHFPYDQGYPKSAARFHPTVDETGEDRTETRINSYFNVIGWAVDRFFGKMFDRLDLSNTAIIYTSDHGQAIYNGKLTHCSVEDADPREGLVPLFAITDNEQLKKRFAAGAILNASRASHFLIRSTVLELMGYPVHTVKKQYGPSMFVQGPEHPRFTSGDIFGVFRKDVYWNDIDLARRLLEFSTPPKPVPGPLVEINR